MKFEYIKNIFKKISDVDRGECDLANRSVKSAVPVWGAIILIVVLGIIIYTNAINNEFLFDDDILIKNNAYIKSPAHIPSIFTENIGSGTGSRSDYYRPIQMLLYMATYHFWKFNVYPYHILNISFHILTALAVYWLINILFKKRNLALFTALLFIAHPIQPESVTYISALADCSGGLFIVLSFIFYIKQAERKNIGMFILLIPIYIIALFSKEVGLVLPILFLLYHYVFKKRLEIYRFLTLAGIALLYFVFRVSLLSAGGSHMSITAILQRLPTFFAAVTGYMVMLFAPFKLYLGHDSKLFSPVDPVVIIGVLIFFSLIGYAIKVRRNQLVFFSIFWFFITLIPISNIYPLHFYMADHYLYLPSIGFFLILASFFSHPYESKKIQTIAVAGFIGLMVFYSLMTIRQNEYWKDPKSFYSKTLEYNPNNPSILSNLANEYKLSGDYDQAIELYQKAIEIQPDYYLAHYNLAVLYNQLGKYEESIVSCKKVIETEPSFSRVYNTLGVAYLSVGNTEEAIKYFEKSVDLFSNDTTALANLGVSYSRIGRIQEAIELFKQAIKINPDYAFAYSSLGVLYQSTGREEEAIVMFKKTLEIDPVNETAQKNLPTLVNVD